MSNQDSNYLLEQLLNNRLSSTEFDEFLAGLHDETAVRAYSDALEVHFSNLLTEHEHPPPPDKRTG